MKFLISIEIFLLLLLAISPVLLNAQDGNTPPVVINGVSIPGDFPIFSQSINEEAAPGEIFITNSKGTPYLMILKNDGTPYFYRRLNDHSLDFKLQANGKYTRWINEGIRGYEVMDEHFQVLDTLKCQNGYDTDEHELQILPNDNALLIATEERSMSEIDPDRNPNSIVLGNHIQEIDNNGTVAFEWSCWEHFNLEDSYIENFDALIVDYIHMNSIAVDFDGHILISSRHLSECTKINRQSGEIIWRLGGKNNQFTFVNDPDQISFQHDFRPVPGKPGFYTLYDNGNLKNPKYSRALEIKLDTVAMTAEKVWEYRHSPDRYSRLMGNVQRLPNGNTLINWGDPALPKITEVNPDGTVVYEADFIPVMNNYRTFRFECSGFMLAPSLVAEPFPDRVRLLFNKFGDEDVDYFNIYGGENPGQMEWIDSSSRTWIDLSDLKTASFFYLEVSAVNASGIESMVSNREKVYVRNSLPGDNLIINGNFSMDDSFWTHENEGDGASTGYVSDSSYHFQITNAGQLGSDVQLYQTDIPLIKGKEYILELDARADAARTINIELERAGTGWTNYSRHGQSYVSTEFTHIEHTFIMEENNDLKSNLVIKGGGSDIDFEVKNFSLRQTVVSGLPDKLSSKTALYCYPNPADREVHISYQLESTSDIHLQLFTLSGQVVETVYSGKQVAGAHDHSLDTEKLANGAYMLNLINGSNNHSSILLIQH